MVDEIYDRQYQAGRQDLHAGIDRAVARFGRAVAAVFRVQQRIHFAAPWDERRFRRMN
ncbi:hypothetical protein G7078_08875 [Sphingomonas sinipercae]|uniref:Uncharacterized protein n=1 Tax=Sphingomonas sinipercae TaxID=2714944 RepID=A0A6G7ZPQ5_9SPHN|nr:hypothetical protein [Sphingomonas sinipercae]QIL02886.1 hypothetical protein G7078_08875 [Sphingomonas sinipercae]